MSKKNDLGKGIRALISNIETKGSEKSKPIPQKTSLGIEMISVDAIEINPFQPRNTFDKESMDELASSIEQHGLIQPITCRKITNKKYQLISGERRLRASKMAGLKTIPAYIRKANDQEMVEMALLENIQRSDLNALEIGISYHRLMQEFGLTHEKLAERVSKKRSTITNYLRILKLPPNVQESLKKELLSMGHARVLAGISDEMLLLDIHDRILANQLSVRATEKLVKAPVIKEIINENEVVLADPFIMDVEKRLRAYLGSKIVIQHTKGGKGKINITYSSTDQLNDIIDSILDE